MMWRKALARSWRIVAKIASGLSGVLKCLRQMMITITMDFVAAATAVGACTTFAIALIIAIIIVLLLLLLLLLEPCTIVVDDCCRQRAAGSTVDMMRTKLLTIPQSDECAFVIMQPLHLLLLL